MRSVLVIIFAAMSLAWPVAVMAEVAPPAVEDFHGVPYLTGGIGEGEFARILGRVPEFNLKMLVATRRGAYLADVKVVVSDAKGVAVLEVRSAGPLLLAKLPLGRYSVKAWSEGQMQETRFSISAHRHADFILRW